MHGDDPSTIATKIADMRARRAQHPHLPPLTFGVTGYCIVRDSEAEANREVDRITSAPDAAKSPAGFANFQQWITGSQLEKKISLRDYSVSNRGLQSGLIGTPEASPPAPRRLRSRRLLPRPAPILPPARRDGTLRQPGHAALNLPPNEPPLSLSAHSQTITRKGLALREPPLRYCHLIQFSPGVLPVNLKAVTASSLASLALVSLFLAGCGAAPRFDDLGSVPSTVGKITGNVHGGQQVVSGSTVQLYATNTTTVKGASSARIASPGVTDGNGNFDITGTYSCPAATSLVYLVVSGGNPGMAAGTNNLKLSMMALLGQCGNLSGTTHVVVNELTTVAAVENLIPFMADGAHIGADLNATPNALALAFSAADTLVDSSTGQYRAVAVGAPTPYYALYNTIADILAACINTTGAGVNGSSYDTTKPCGQLLFYAGTGLAPYAYSTYAPDTLAAMLRIAQAPATNVGSLFTLVGGAAAPFQPTIATQPNDFTPPLTVTLPFIGANSFNYPRHLAIDSQQNIWIAQNAAPYISVYDQNMKLVRSIVSDTYSIADLQADPSGNIWAYGFGILSKYAPDGTQLSPLGGWSFSAAGFRPSGTAMTIDVNGNVWINGLQAAGTQGSACFIKISPSGVALFAAPGVCVSAGGAQYGLSLTSDPSGNVYMSTQNPVSVIKVNNAGTLLNGPTGTLTGYPTLYIKYHAQSDQILGLSQPSIYAFKASDLSYVGYYIGSGHNLENTSILTLDGAGNLWFGNTPSIGNSGTVTSAAAELTVPFSVTAWRSLALRHQIPGDVGLSDPEGVGVDAYGNLWLVNYGNRTLTKIPAIAVPRTTQVP